MNDVARELQQMILQLPAWLGGGDAGTLPARGPGGDRHQQPFGKSQNNAIAASLGFWCCGTVQEPRSPRDRGE